MAVAAILGFLAIVFGLIIIYVGAFRVHLAWGVLSVLLAPIVLPAFIVRHWRLARGGLLLLCVGMVTVSYAAFSEAQWPPHRYLLSLTKPENMGTYGRLLWGRTSTNTGTPVNAAPIEPQQVEPRQADNNTAELVNQDTQKQQGEKSVDQQSAQQPVTNQPAMPEQPAAKDAGDIPVTGDKTTNKKDAPPPEVLEKIAAQEQAELPVKYVEFSTEDLPAYFGMQVRLTDIDGKVHEAVLKDQEGPQLVMERSYSSGGVVKFRLERRNIVKLEAVHQ